MSKSKLKRIKRLKNRKIWPLVIIFIFVSSIIVGAMILAVEAFVMYLLQKKAETSFDASINAARIVNERVEHGMSYEEAIKYVLDNEFYNESIVILDRNNEFIASHGENTINFLGYISFSDETKRIYFDKSMEIAPSKDGSMVFDDDNSIIATILRNYDFSDNNILVNGISLPFWTCCKIGSSDSYFYGKMRVDISGKDLANIGAVALIAFVILSVPIVIVFVMMVSSIVSQRNVMKLLYTDQTTGGNNWEYFVAYGQRFIQKRKNRNYAVINFKLQKYRSYLSCHGINETEELLERIDTTLKSMIGKKEIVAHNAYADFALLIICNDMADCVRRIDSMFMKLAGVSTHRITFHAGIYWVNYGSQVIPISDMYSCAVAATASIDNQRSNEIAEFNANLMQNQMWEHQVEDTMEAAMANEEFVVYLQPKYSPVTEELVGAEALVRWISPTAGFIPPNKFIPIFEENGFVTKLDDYMIAHVARLQSNWIAQGKKVVPISVNVSRAHFLMGNLAEHICELVDTYNTPHEYIELELTESAFFEDKTTIIETVDKLKKYGFAVSMDDFGSGYSSLNSLKELDLDILKLDAEFFRGEGNENRGDIVVSEAISLAKKLEMKIVAEGIEKKEQVDFLAERGCDMIQGYYYAKPMPVNEFELRMEK